VPRRWQGFVPIVLLAALACLPAVAQPLSPRNAGYEIDVRLDTAGKMLEGSQKLTWTNLQERPAEELRFHLYWNGWLNDRSTWLLERRLKKEGKRREDPREEDWAWIEVGSARLVRTAIGVAGAAEGDTESTTEAPGSGPPAIATEIDLTPAMRFDAPDDGNAFDRTVLALPLPEPILPGETVRVEMDWRARIPRIVDRTGYRGDFYFLAHWFPKLGVFEPDGWNCHQYHASTEYYSDYGSYDVRMTVPAGWVVGSTGREVDRTDNADGSVTHRYRQDDVHAFSWTTSPDFRVATERFERPGLPPVEMRLLYQPEHEDQVARHFDATAAALLHYGTWYGPYPYGHVTLVDTPFDSEAGGMEYPTFFTCGTRLFAPFGGDRPESVTVHEAGHQFWYGLVGNNEFEHAWIDEGLNTFSTQRTLDVAFGPRLYVRRYLNRPGEPESNEGFFPLLYHDIEVPRWMDRMRRYRPSATSDVQSEPTWRYHPDMGYDHTYSKTALWLRTLEHYLGWETLQEILSTFFQRYRFRHPVPRDFLAVADEVSGQDLGWFFDQVFFGSDSFDYAIQSVDSFPVGPAGWVERDGERVYVEPLGDDADSYRTEVVVERRGGAWFPVDVLLVFEDGSDLRLRWPGQERWKLIVEERPARLAHAVVDPEHVLQLDLNYTNNSMRREPDSKLPALKWGARWMIWLQDLLATFAFFG
jgi:hypothetical protein